jgi:hypothetical protein
LKFFDIGEIYCHSPTENAKDVGKDALYEALGNAYNQCASHDIKSVIGDFNSQKGNKTPLGKQALFQFTITVTKMN